MDARFLHSLATDASVEQVAAASMRLWREIDTALSPIIGQQGVAALVRRSRHLVRDEYPWLAPNGDLHAGPAPSDLQAALLAQTAVQATHGNVALLQVFQDLLASLIGDSLGERLLRSISSSTPGGPAAQDPLP